MRGRLAILLDNAVLVRELRRRIRGRAVIYGFMIYVALMSLCAYVVLYVKSKDLSARSARNVGELLSHLSEIGQTVFTSMTLLQAFFVLIVAPIMVSAMTTLDKEKKTIEFLQVTPTKSGSYVLGALASVLFYVVLVLFCGLPVVSICFLYAGIGLEHVVVGFAFLLGGSAILSSIALWLSSAQKRYTIAQALTVCIALLAFYCVVNAFTVPVPFFFGYSPPLFWWLVPGHFFVYLLWLIVWACSVGVLSAFFMIIASRKLYNPNAHPFSYLQFFILFMVSAVSLLWLGMDSAEVYWLYLSISGSLLLGGVLAFSVGRMEIGDEVWRLKLCYSSLRRVDVNLWYLLGLLAIWVGISYPGADWTIRDEIAILLPSFAAQLFFLAMCGRLITELGAERRFGVRLLFGIAILLFLIVPLAAAVILDDLWIESTILEALVQLAPFLFILDNLRDDWFGFIRFDGSTLFFLEPSVFTIPVYVVAGACVGVLRRVVRDRKHAARDFHYEFPV